MKTILEFVPLAHTGYVFNPESCASLASFVALCTKDCESLFCQWYIDYQIYTSFYDCVEHAVCSVRTHNPVQECIECCNVFKALLNSPKHHLYV